MGGNRSSAGRSTDWPRRRVAAIALAGALTMACVGSADAFVFWANRDAGTIGRAKSNGHGVDQSYINARASVYGVAVDEDHIYWTDRRGGAIGRASRSGGNVKRKLVTGLSSPHGMAVDSPSYIYWADSGSDSMAARRWTGAAPTRTSSPVRMAPRTSRWMRITCIGPTPGGSAARTSTVPAPI